MVRFSDGRTLTTYGLTLKYQIRSSPLEEMFLITRSHGSARGEGVEKREPQCSLEWRTSGIHVGDKFLFLSTYFYSFSFSFFSDQDDFSFHIFPEPEDMLRHFEEQFRRTFQGFGMMEFPSSK